MQKTKILPCVMIAIDIAAAVVYGVCAHDWRKVGYWLSAAALNIFITF